MDKKITVSVITVCYNHAKGLKHTMKSVLEQTYDGMEYIIIDGGSTDGSRELIEAHKERLGYWRSEPDGGIYDAMNKGLAKAQGEYCLFLNAGDYFCDKKVLDTIFADKNNEEDLIIGRQKFYDGKGRLSVAWSIRKEDINERFFWSNTLPHQSTFIKTSLLRELGGYDLHYKICADWAFWYVAVVERHCSLCTIDTAVSLMEKGGVSQNMEKCREEMATFLMEHHSEMKKEDWKDISERYSEALMYRRATKTALSKLLMRIAIRINKE